MADRPWWQTTKTARAGFMLGFLWIAFGLGELLAAVGRPQHRGPLFVMSLAGAMVFVVLGGTYLVTAALLRRRERAGPPGRPGLPPSS